MKFNEYKKVNKTIEKTQEAILYHNKDIAINIDSKKDEFKYAEIIYCDGSKTIMSSEKVYDGLIKINIDKNTITLQPSK